MKINCNLNSIFSSGGAGRTEGVRTPEKKTYSQETYTNVNSSYLQGGVGYRNTVHFLQLILFHFLWVPLILFKNLFILFFFFLQLIGFSFAFSGKTSCFKVSHSAPRYFHFPSLISDEDLWMYAYTSP